MIYPVGHLLTFEYGCYSDRTYMGPFVVLRELDRTVAYKTFIDNYRTLMPTLSPGWDNDIDEERDIRPPHFIAWLVREEYIEDPPNAHEWYLGAYGLVP